MKTADNLIKKVAIDAEIKSCPGSVFQKILTKIFPYRSYLVDFAPKFHEHNGVGHGYIKGARSSHFLSNGQVERIFSNNY